MRAATLMTTKQLIDEGNALRGMHRAGERANELAMERMNRTDKMMDLPVFKTEPQIQDELAEYKLLPESQDTLDSFRIAGTELMNRLAEGKRDEEQIDYNTKMKSHYKRGRFNEDIELAVVAFTKSVDESCEIEIKLPSFRRCTFRCSPHRWSNGKTEVEFITDCTTVSINISNEENEKGGGGVPELLKFLVRRMT